MDTKFAVIWFEGADIFTLVDRKGKLVKLSEREAKAAPSITGVLKSQSDVELAVDDLKYAIYLDLLEDLFGCDVD